MLLILIWIARVDTIWPLHCHCLSHTLEIVKKEGVNATEIGGTGGHDWCASTANRSSEKVQSNWILSRKYRSPCLAVIEKFSIHFQLEKKKSVNFWVRTGFVRHSLDGEMNAICRIAESYTAIRRHIKRKTYEWRISSEWDGYIVPTLSSWCISGTYCPSR